MEISIEPVLRADAAGVKEFMAAVIRNSITRDEPTYSDMVGNATRNVDWWLEHPAEAVHLKAVIGGRLAGVVLVKSSWNLCSLFVDPVHQRHGIGSRLLHAAIDACRGKSPKNAIWLNASPGAVSFYAAHGFRVRASSQSLPPGFVAMELPL